MTIRLTPRKAEGLKTACHGLLTNPSPTLGWWGNSVIFSRGNVWTPTLPSSRTRQNPCPPNYLLRF
ncbi:hypothetical protein P5673_010815 [Acropora cervicornis]|uniref:Uncharacterized protein n=1 Tax=Acropora cervicornis TaxID=6130 RepID=A0AAD9QRA6_ACRCE|nr:hypothetical protein P5673_010815 [Acropora cervicornis]